jgi:type I restriction enzyme M protein
VGRPARSHTEEARFSKRVTMERIEEEGFNLNISRYISTAQAEEAIDLKAVHQQLVDIEKEITQARDKHNEFLKELGLPPLP